MLAVHAATAPGNVEKLSAIVAAELADLADKGPGSAELHRSSAQLKAGLLMALESSSVRAEQMARHLITHGELIPSQELVARVDAVTQTAVRDVAARLAHAKPTVAIVGSGKKSQAQADRTAEIMSRFAARPEFVGV